MKIKHNLQSAIDLVLPKIFGHRKKELSLSVSKNLILLKSMARLLLQDLSGLT